MTNDTVTPEKAALLEAFDTVLKTQADEREAQRLRPRRDARPAQPPLIWACAAIVLLSARTRGGTGGVFSAAPESMAVKEASLRIAIANAAQHVERFSATTGSRPILMKPAPMATASPTSGSAADRLAVDGAERGRAATLASADPLAKFLGNSFASSRRGGDEPAAQGFTHRAADRDDRDRAAGRVDCSSTWT
jgi:hypothetical protein